MSYTWSLSKTSEGGWGNNGGFSGKPKDDQEPEKQNEDEKEWNIYKKLEKKDSTARVTIF